MKTVILVIGVIQNGESILLRKKPDGSPPYAEPWYLFGGTLDGDQQDPERALQDIVRTQAGIEIRATERLTWDTERKPGHDGEETFFVYLALLCEYVSGELVGGPGVERVEWAPIDRLPEYDHVPPSRKLLTEIGFLPQA